MNLDRLKKSRWGMSLIEVLITVGLFGTFLAIIGNVCVEGVRALQKGKNRVGTQQEALLSIDRLCRELKETHSDTITTIYSIENIPSGDLNFDAVSFGTPKDNDDASSNFQYQANGEFKWRRYIIYSKKVGDVDVYRTVVNIQGPKGDSFPSPLAVLDITDGINDALGPGIRTYQKKMARDIYSLAFTVRAVTPVVKGINIRVLSRIKSGKDGAGNSTYETTELNTFVRPWR